MDKHNEPHDDMPAEYDEQTLRQMLKNGVRGKFAAKYREGNNLVKLAPDIAAVPAEKAVNDALRGLMREKAAPV